MVDADGVNSWKKIVKCNVECLFRYTGACQSSSGCKRAIYCWRCEAVLLDVPEVV